MTASSLLEEINEDLAMSCVETQTNYRLHTMEALEAILNELEDENHIMYRDGIIHKI